MIKLVIIDFDDTLCLTEKACFEMENHVAQNMGFPPMTRVAHIQNWGKPLEEAILERVPGIDTEIFMAEIEKIMPELMRSGKLDVISDINFRTLDKLRKLGYKIAILTSRTVMEVKHLLDEKHPLTAKIDAFYHKGNTEYRKPDPRVYDRALLHFNLKPQDAVYIGDNLSDAESAKNAGLHFIALLESELRSKENFKSVKVDYFANKFSDIVDYIIKN
ncbi:MAG: HAD family hydrolase [Candidatus Levybacteria bacterium]|nr:HAD family hydrolase [Candidatus Levybacteria bacterium]